MSRIYTTGEVAKICGVGMKTVAKWIDTGVLKGYRVPESKHRRVSKSDLILFMTEHNIPIPEKM